MDRRRPTAGDSFLGRPIEENMKEIRWVLHEELGFLKDGEEERVGVGYMGNYF
jgi:hypothetical protein